MRTFTMLLAIGASLLVVPAPAGASAAAQGPPAAAPGAPGTVEDFLPADKSGYGTATSTRSRVWLTVQKEGGLGEIFYPDLGTPSARLLRFAVSDGRTATDANRAARVRTELVDERSLGYRQVFTERAGRWRLTATYLTDPSRDTVLADVRFVAFDRRHYDVHAIYDPALANTRGDDTGRTERDALVATDGRVASAFAGWPPFAATSSGYRGASDGWTDLAADGRLDHRYRAAAAPGNLVQTASLRFTGRGQATLALGFGADAAAALGAARGSLTAGFPAVSRGYTGGWHRYLAGLPAPPRVLGGAEQRRLYRVSVMVLAASEDKTHRGAYIASPSMPWVWGAEEPSGPYHLVWSRDLYQIATALIAAGDVAGAGRALDYLFTVQQKPDGSFPQNSHVDGTPVWEGLQLDEVAFPIVLAHQLGRADAGTWDHVRRAADFLLGAGPVTPQERWENQSGYSPATIASEIAALVCAADIARANGDSAAATRYLATADEWQASVKSWTVTTTGPYSSGPYFLRLTKDGNPDAGTTYTIGDSGPSNVDQRRVVDPSFLDLVRLGVLPADDPAVVNTLPVIDEQLGVRTARGLYWHRASFDGYGEKRDGSRWEFGLPDDSRITLGRAWPLLNGERGEYQIAAGDTAGARRQLTAMARAAGPGHMLPEQVWDHQPPGTFEPGTPTFSATPLTWTHAQYVRLAHNLAAGRILEQPAVVAARYR
ncbi:glycoside hydrolase family 15 protein [Phytohabitans houttuyneae]|uniref:glycoside hydrolase family 15 protein n=1 Tax=Phytohabitans houttuyneae TaxID=1076126 RepID=UPI0031EB5190